MPLNRKDSLRYAKLANGAKRSPMLRGRFAPSPSGRMHLGNAFTCLMAWLAARSVGGEIVLRVDDLDPRNGDPKAAQLVMEDLAWLGLDWDEGPLYQRDQNKAYETAIVKLTQLGLVYPCFCTRRELHATQAPHASDGTYRYPGTCRALSSDAIAERLAKGQRAGLRLSVEGAPGKASATVSPETRNAKGDRAIDCGFCGLTQPSVAHLSQQGDLTSRPTPTLSGRPTANTRSAISPVISFSDEVYGRITEDLRESTGDILIRRSDGVVAYQLACVVDDGDEGVTQVVRGRDLLSSTARQIYLQELLGLPRPSYLHVPLLITPDGRRLAKRDHDLDLGALRCRYGTPEPVLGALAHAVGMARKDERVSARELIDRFSVTLLQAHQHDIVVDESFLP